MATRGLNLSNLPTELIGAVFDELDIVDTCYLSIVARSFWEIGWPYIVKKAMGFIGPWAGHRLVCLGEGPIEDYPPYMLSEDEKEELVEGLDADEYDDDDDEKSHAGSPVDLGHIASSRYEEAGVDVPPRHVSRMLAAIARYEMYKMPESMRSKMRELIDIDLSKYYPEDRRWVLRNLTTHEFIRAEALAGNSEENGPYIRDLGFEHIALSRIFWSSSSGSATFSGRSVNRGIWAGHRLEITTLDRHTKSVLSDVVWKDISEDAVEDIIQLWRAARNWLDDGQRE